MVAGGFNAAETLVELSPRGAQPWQRATTLSPARPRVLIASSDAMQRERLKVSLRQDFAVTLVASAAETGRALREADIELLIVGSALADVTPERLAEVVCERDLCAVISASDSPNSGPSIDGVFYQVNRNASSADLCAIARSALTHRAALSDSKRAVLPEPEAQLQRAGELHRLGESARKVALQRTPRDAARVLASAIVELLDADRSAFLYFDPESGTLWSEAGDASDDYEGSATQGLAGFVARVGAGLSVGRAEADPRYLAELDNRHGAAGDRLALEPVVGPDGQVHGVLVAARGETGAAFSSRECETLQAYAARCAPVLDALALQAEAQDIRSEVGALEAPSIYRREALEVYSHRKLHGEVVRVAAGWTRIVFWMLAVFALSAACYAWFARVNQYATGAAVVLTRGRTEITAKLPGTLSSLAVSPGDAVHKGDVLARFYDAADAAELASLQRQFERELIRRLRDPSDSTAERALRSVSAQRARTLARLEERTLRAPVDGVVGDLRVPQGQLVAAGQHVLSILGADRSVELVAAVPAGHRSSLRAGMTVRVNLIGHPGHYLDVPISSVSQDAMSADAIRVAFGDELASMVPRGSTVVLVRAELPAEPIEVNGKRVQLRHGMQAVADVRVRSERVLTALIPGLRDALGSSRNE